MFGAKSAEETLQNVVKFLVAGEDTSRAIDVLEAQFDRSPGEPRQIIGAVSWGFEATVNAKANSLPRKLGAFRYIVGLIACLPVLRAAPTRVSAEGFEFSGPVLAASLANIKSLGGGIKLFPEAEFDDGLADLVMVASERVRTVVPHVRQILTGENHPYRVAARVQRVRVETEQSSYADGESLGQGPFTLQVKSGALRLIPGADIH